jgi:hypothetical protein
LFNESTEDFEVLGSCIRYEPLIAGHLRKFEDHRSEAAEPLGESNRNISMRIQETRNRPIEKPLPGFLSWVPY